REVRVFEWSGGARYWLPKDGPAVPPSASPPRAISVTTPTTRSRRPRAGRSAPPDRRIRSSSIPMPASQTIEDVARDARYGGIVEAVRPVGAARRHHRPARRVGAEHGVSMAQAVAARGTVVSEERAGMELELVLRTRREWQRGRAPVERCGRCGGENLERPRSASG